MIQGCIETLILTQIKQFNTGFDQLHYPDTVCIEQLIFIHNKQFNTRFVQLYCPDTDMD